MIGYFKHTEGDEWQDLGTVVGRSLSVVEPTDSFKAETPHKASISFELPASALSKELRASLYRKYPKLPRKLKKEIKSFRKLIGLPYKKCSRYELLQSYLMVTEFSPSGNINPAWLTRAGWRASRKEVLQ